MMLAFRRDALGVYQRLVLASGAAYHDSWPFVKRLFANREGPGAGSLEQGGWRAGWKGFWT